MSDDMTTKVVAALRDMAAKVDETVVAEVPDIDRGMSWQQHGQPFPTRTEERPKYERAWLSGRLLGMADALEAVAPPSPTKEI